MSGKQLELQSAVTDVMRRVAGFSVADQVEILALAMPDEALVEVEIAETAPNIRTESAKLRQFVALVQRMGKAEVTWCADQLGVSYRRARELATEAIAAGYVTKPGRGMVASTGLAPSSEEVARG